MMVGPWKEGNNADHSYINYPNKSKFKTEVKPPTDALSQEKIQEIRRCFDMFDIDQDGRISVNEIATTMRLMGQNPSDKEINEMLQEVDKDDNGYVEWHEFYTLMKKKLKSPAEEYEEMRHAFEVFDRDGDGRINLNELRTALTEVGEKLTPREVEDIFHAADKDRDGSLNYIEFVNMICSGSMSEEIA